MRRTLSVLLCCVTLSAQLMACAATEPNDDPTSSTTSAAVTTTPVVLTNAVGGGDISSYRTDPRVFNAEFYRKFNASRNLADDTTAQADWLAYGIAHCLRGSFEFNATDYKARYADLSSLSCDAAMQHYVYAGFEEGRIGSFDSAPTVFNVDDYATANVDLYALLTQGTWDRIDLEIHWLAHGMPIEGRVSSRFFHIQDYQARYPDVPRDYTAAVQDFVINAPLAWPPRLGILAWADPAQWNQVVMSKLAPVVTAGPYDAVRTFTGAHGSPVKVIVKSPTWYVPGKAWSTLTTVCSVGAPAGAGKDDSVALQGALDKLGSGACKVVQLTQGASYTVTSTAAQNADFVPHLVINGATDYVLDGNGATINFTGERTGLLVNGGARGMIQNLTIDWTGLLYEATGVLTVGNGVATVALDLTQAQVPAGFQPNVSVIAGWDKTKNMPVPSPYVYQSIDPNQTRLTLSFPGGKPTLTATDAWLVNNLSLAAKTASSPGNVLVRFYKLPADAISIGAGTTDTRLVGDTIHAAPYMGIQSQYAGRGLSIENFTETPSQGRPTATNADGIHITSIPGDVIIDGATISGLGDDAINLATTWNTIDSVAGASYTAQHTATNSDGAYDPMPPTAGDEFAFFDETLAFVGTAVVTSASDTASAMTVKLTTAPSWLRAGLKAIDLARTPSRFYINNETAQNSCSRGLLIGGFHGMIQNSHYNYLTGSAIDFHFSTYWSEGMATSDVVIQNNSFISAPYEPVFYNYADGMASLPMRNAALAIFSEVTSDDFAGTAYQAIADVLGQYPVFQDIRIAGNTFNSPTGAGIFATAISNRYQTGSAAAIASNQFPLCAVVRNPQIVPPDPNVTPQDDGQLRLYFGSDSPSGIVLQYADDVAMTGNTTTTTASCDARYDYASGAEITLQ